MKILVTNDDGVNFHGLWTLVEAMRPLGQVTVVAPDREQSGVGASITLANPLRVNKMVYAPIDVPTYSVDGTPGDAVIVGLASIMEEGCDLVVSGINQGHNTTNEIYISGTVGAALHARWRGIPAISLSVFQLDSTHQPVAAKLAALLVRKMLDGLLPKDVLYNCNVPHKELPEVEGLEITRLGLRNFADVVDVQDTRGRKTYWLQRKRTNVDIDEGTDFYALTKARIAITPLDNHLNVMPNAISPEVAQAIWEEMRAAE